MFTYFCKSNFSIAISRCLLLVVIVGLPFVGGCGEDDNPIVDEHEGEEDAPFHADADGFFLEVEETEVYRQFQGTSSGGLTVEVGEEIEVHVTFIDPSGAEVHVGEEEGEEEDEHGHDEEEAFSLGLTGYDTAIIDIHLPEGEEEHAEEEHEEEEWRFEVVGLKAGTTEITLQFLHGDHPDFTAALPIPVTVK